MELADVLLYICLYMFFQVPLPDAPPNSRPNSNGEVTFLSGHTRGGSENSDHGSEGSYYLILASQDDLRQCFNIEAPGHT